MSSAAQRPYSYATGLDEHHRRVAIFQCIECGEKGLVTNPKEMPPEVVTKAILKKGWSAHPFRKNDTYCPRCSGPTKSQSKTGSEPAVSVTPIKQIAAVEVRQPTPDQRVKIRNFLDKSFDDASGMYLDGLSDQKIAEIVDVPRIIVERLREAAYGPIKVDPFLAGLRAEIDGLKKEIEGQQKGMDNLKGKLGEITLRLEKGK